jgi:hypothetical protein
MVLGVDGRESGPDPNELEQGSQPVLAPVAFDSSPDLINDRHRGQNQCLLLLMQYFQSGLSTTVPASTLE